MKVSFGKNKIMVSSGITKNRLSKSEVDPCGVCSLRVKVNSVLCVQCGKWIHDRCVRVKRVTPKISRNFTCRKCEGNIVEAVEQEEKICDEVGMVKQFTYLGYWVSAAGGCEAAVTARTRCGWVKLRECGELLYGRRFHLMWKGVVNKSLVRPAILYESDA